MSEKTIISVKEYAKQSSRTVQSVYQQMKREGNAVLLHGHIIEKTIGNRKIKFLDEYAVQVLNESRQNNPAIIQKTDNEERIEELLQINHNQLIKITEQADKIAKQAEELLHSKTLLLESQSETELEKEKRLEVEKKQQDLKSKLVEQQKASEELHQKLQELNRLLEQEQTRKLSFSERFFGRKKSNK